jgi:Zn-dependent alcohol dehydrogenase
MRVAALLFVLVPACAAAAWPGGAGAMEGVEGVEGAVRVRAGEHAQVSICYNYGCSREAEVRFHRARLLRLGARLGQAANAEEERARLAGEIGMLYRIAATQSPVAADRAGNYLDGGVEGRMDCIDHATSTTRLLKLLEARGWLRFHRVAEPARRTRFIFQHFSAVIEERSVEKAGPNPGGADGVPPANAYVVDSWFGDNGEPAVVLPLAEWLNGGGPNVQ